jgi:hypothetical protein
MFSLITGIIGLVVAVAILVLMRRDRLHVQHGLGWILVATGFALLGFSPGVIDQLAVALGIGYPPVLGLTLAIGILVVKVLFMDIERSRVEIRNQRLVQRVAMLETDLNEMRKSWESTPWKNVADE